MRKPVLLLACIIALSSCNKDRKEAKSPAPPCAADSTAQSGGGKEFKMYEMSEMSALMEQMYVDNQRLKDRIKKGDTIGRFPSHFLDIHKAVMTDDKENDAFFKKQAAAFIRAQQLIYEDPKNAAQHFNDGVNACIACHQVKCSGPIPRIKKLYIQ